jgi:hypothetical protein
MAEMKNLNQAPRLVDLVVDENRAVDQLTHLRPFADSVSHAWKPPEQIHLIEQGLSKTGSGVVMVAGDMPHDPREIV